MLDIGAETCRPTCTKRVNGGGQCVARPTVTFPAAGHHRLLIGPTQKVMNCSPAVPLSANNLGHVVHTHMCLCHRAV